MAKSREQKRLERKQQKAKVRAAQYAAAAARKKQKGQHVAKNRPVKVNGYANGGFGRDRTPEDKPHSGKYGHKEQVKKGVITACEALAGGHIPVDSATGQWLTKKAKAQKC